MSTQRYEKLQKNKQVKNKLLQVDVSNFLAHLKDVRYAGSDNNPRTRHVGVSRTEMQSYIMFAFAGYLNRTPSKKYDREKMIT